MSVVDLHGRPVPEPISEPMPTLYDTIIAQNKEAAMHDQPQEPELTPHQKMCKSVGDMFQAFYNGLGMLRESAQLDAALTRSICWENKHGAIVGVPFALRQIRRDLEWLEKFYARGVKE